MVVAITALCYGQFVVTSPSLRNRARASPPRPPVPFRVYGHKAYKQVVRWSESEGPPRDGMGDIPIRTGRKLRNTEILFGFGYRNPFWFRGRTRKTSFSVLQIFRIKFFLRDLNRKGLGFRV